ncbi:MAG: glycosyltransferase, partial [Paludibacter sp.]|nr:glycosyltransferase [Paludibacter sp.]
MSAPLVSIITPTYNHEKYIGDCIRSAQDQTYTNWEMIIVDDGSTDNTFTIAQAAA